MLESFIHKTNGARKLRRLSQQWSGTLRRINSANSLKPLDCDWEEITGTLWDKSTELAPIAETLSNASTATCSPPSQGDDETPTKKFRETTRQADPLSGLTWAELMKAHPCGNCKGTGI